MAEKTTAMLFIKYKSKIVSLRFTFNECGEYDLAATSGMR